MTTKPQSTDILTGVRPTADLTVANYLGAIKPIIDLQKKNKKLKTFVFAADLHGMTNTNPFTVKKLIRNIILNYLALGLDPQQTVIYIQSAIGPETAYLTALLARYTTVAELLRIPTLKEKLKGKKPEQANALLFLYPIMMAADILIQKAKKVPVGQDQMPHMEMTRKLARGLNKELGQEILPIPEGITKEALNIKALVGDNKMSKTEPKGAIFLTDSPQEAASKIKKAQTGEAGIMTNSLESHIMLTKLLATNEKDIKEVDNVIKQHLAGEAVMGKFKETMTKVIVAFLENFQAKRKEFEADPKFVDKILEEGNQLAKDNAQTTITEIEKAFLKK